MRFVNVQLNWNKLVMKTVPSFTEEKVRAR